MRAPDTHIPLATHRPSSRSDSAKPRFSNKFHEAEFAQADLAFDLPEFHRSNADLIVAVFCRDYDTKDWCRLEWRNVFSLIKNGHAKMILLSRFDRAEGRGLADLSGFIELDDKTPEEFASLILGRLAIHEGNPKDHYTKPSPPPVVVLKTDIPPALLRRS